MRASSPRSSWMLVTPPISTPLNLTGEPTERPSTEPEKYMTNGVVSAKSRPEPKTTIPPTASAIAPTTNAPIAIGLAFLPMRTPLLPRLLLVALTAREKAPHLRVGVATLEHLLGRPLGDDGLALDVE